MVRHPRCVFINYNWIKLTVEHNYLVVRYMSFITRYQLHVSALMAIFKLT